MAIITDPDWIDPEETTFDVEKPIRSEQGVMLAGNPIAIAQGKPGAPRIRANAMATAVDLPLTVTAADTYSVLLGHGFVGGTTSTNSGSYVVAATLPVLSLTGTVRYVARHAGTSGAANIDLRVMKNGVQVASWTMDSTSYVTRSSDIPVVPGDVIEWQHRGSSTSTSNFLFREPTASNGYFQFTPMGVYVP